MEKMKELKKKASRWFCRYINGTKGVISLFLALLMVPFVMVAGVLINAGRINSAVAIFDEALCNASNSTLGTYDAFLRTRFGLLAISQDFPDKGVNYTTEQFIAETFEFYMEKNCQSLGNTYSNMNVSAAGVYPLADTDVLRSQVLENAKYSVPLKMVIDGFNLDDLLKSLTDKLSMFTKIANLATNTVKAVTAYDDLDEKFDTLVQAIEKCTTDYNTYTQKYNSFSSAVAEYNNLIDERDEEIAACEAAVESAQEEKDNCQETFDALEKESKAIFNEIRRLKNEKDDKGNPVDNSDEIAALEEELTPYYEAEEALQAAENALVDAEDTLQYTIEYYREAINNQRDVVSNEKTAYLTQTSTLITDVTNLNSAISSAQVAANDLINTGADTITSVVSIGHEAWKESREADIEDLKAQRNAAKSEGNEELVKDYDQQIKELEDQYDKDKAIAKNLESVVKSDEDKLDAVVSLEEFAKTDYRTPLETIYTELNKRKTNVDNIKIPSDGKMPSLKKDVLYLSEFELPISKATVEKLLDGLFQETMASSFITVIKAIVGFISALFEMLTEIGHDHDLESVIDTSKYGSIGGLPSSRSQSSYKSQYHDADYQKSEENKEILGEYSNNGSAESAGVTVASVIETIRRDISTIKYTIEEKDWNIWTFVGNLSDITSSVADIVTQIGQMVKIMLETLWTSVSNAVSNAVDAAYSKMLLVGYLGYNTANRTTYQKSALTGASYAASLPSTSDKNASGYAFYGAETEYIIYGSTSETANQRGAFFSIFGVRLIYNAFIVLGNAEAQAVATAAGAVTFGIGYYLVLILWVVLEALVDTIILCNGGNVRTVKTIPYLSIQGIPEIISAFANITLSKASTEKLKSLSAEALNKMTNSVDDPEKRAKINSAFYSNYTQESSLSGKSEKILSAITFDYTKMLMLYMIFCNSDKLLKRFSDIIQMEASWQQYNKNFYATFDLGKSYTYLRVAGSFTSSQFIRIADEDPTAKESIIYRGY